MHPLLLELVELQLPCLLTLIKRSLQKKKQTRQTRYREKGKQMYKNIEPFQNTNI